MIGRGDALEVVDEVDAVANEHGLTVPDDLMRRNGREFEELVELVGLLLPLRKIRKGRGPTSRGRPDRAPP